MKVSKLFLCVLVTLTQGMAGRPYSEERQILDRHLAQVARALPDRPSPDEDEALLRQLAEESGLRTVEVGAPTVTETGALGQSRRSFSAASTYPDADRFFRAVQTATRLIDVESLVLRPSDFGVRLEAGIRFYHRAARVVPLAALDPGRMRDRTRGATREEAERFARDEQLVLEKSIALDELRRRQTSPRMFLAEIGASFRDAAATLTFGSLDGDTGRFSLRGVVAGMGAADALERRLEGGFFRLREFTRAQRDGCYQFEAVGESYRAGPQAALALPLDEPFRPTEGFCATDRDNTRLGTAGSVLRASGSENGGISLRAVEVDLVDVASMLEMLSHQPFVVSEDVRGRVTLEFKGVSVEEALEALPVRAARVGTVRLLTSRTGSLGPIAGAEEEPPAARLSFRDKRTPGEDVLSALAEAEPTYVALGPSSLSRLSVFARDAPASDIRRAALAALQLTEGIEESARILRLPGQAGEVGPVASSGSGHVIFRARDLAVEEIGLAGIGESGNELLAFVYSPLGDLVALRNGDSLADGIIADLDANGLFIDTAEGPVRISLSLPRSR